MCGQRLYSSRSVVLYRFSVRKMFIVHPASPLQAAKSGRGLHALQNLAVPRGIHSGSPKFPKPKRMNLNSAVRFNAEAQRGRDAGIFSQFSLRKAFIHKVNAKKLKNALNLHSLCAFASLRPCVNCRFQVQSPSALAELFLTRISSPLGGDCGSKSRVVVVGFR